jgi:bacterioferritin (cytochrome b1)
LNARLADELTVISQTDREAHIDWIEAQLDEIKQMGIQNYPVEQID